MLFFGQGITGATVRFRCGPAGQVVVLFLRVGNAPLFHSCGSRRMCPRHCFSNGHHPHWFARGLLENVRLRPTDEQDALRR